MEIVVNGETRQIEETVCISDLLAELGLASRQVAVEVNLELAPRANHAERLLKLDGSADGGVRV